MSHHTRAGRRLVRLFAWTLCLAFSTQIIAAQAPASAAADKDGAHVAGENARLTEVGGKCAQLISGAPVSGECAETTQSAPARLKIVSYNIRWRSGDELRSIITALKTDAAIGGAQIIGLQEVDRARSRSLNTNTARVIATELGMNYAWAAPALPVRKNEKRDAPDAREEETGVALISPFPLTDVVRLILPRAGPGGRRRAAIGATVNINGRSVRVYSVHAETRVSADERTEQLTHVLDDLARRLADVPAVVLGDFNTWQPASKRGIIELFTGRDFATPFPPGEPTFRHRLVRLRLDWVWLRGFAPATSHGIARHLKVSDHYPLWLEAALTPAPSSAANR